MALELNADGLSEAFVVLGAAGLVIPAFARVRVSPIVGFILVGVLVGPHLLGALAPRYPWLSWLTITDAGAIAPFAELGIILLLFTIGLELSPARLWALRRTILGFGGAELLGCTVLIAAIFLLLGNSATAAFGLGLALALSSTGLVLPIAGATSAVGRLALAMLLFEDIALVPIVFILGAVGGAGDIAGLIRTLGLGVLLMLGMVLLGRLALPPLFAQAARTKSPELFVAASLLVVLSASLATLAAGLSPILGALAAGLLIADTDYAAEVEAVVMPFKGLALGVFLISIGMSLDLALVALRWPELLAAVVAVVLAKTLVTAGLLRLGGVDKGVAAETGLLMAAPSETTLIVLSTALTVGLIRPDAAAFWTVVTAIGLIITPMLARLGRAAARRIERGQPVEESEADASPRTVLIGFGRVGRLVGELLSAHGRNWVAIESDVDLVRAARAEGLPVRFGDAARPDTIERLGLDRADAVVLTMDDAVQAVRLAGRIRAARRDLTIVARARDAAHAARLYQAGATDAVPEALESSLQLSEAVLVELGVAMGPVIASIHAKRDELRRMIQQEADLAVAPHLKSRSG